MTEDQIKIAGLKIWSVQESVFRKLASDIDSFDVARKAAINSHIIGKVVGETTDDSVLAEPSELGEFCFRLSQVIEALLAFERMSFLFDRIPLRGLDMSPSKQLMMFIKHFIDSVYEFQEKNWKLHESATPFAKEETPFCWPTKKQFILQFLVALKPIVDRRDGWVHDQPIFEKRLERLSSLEMWIEIDPASIVLPFNRSWMKKQYKSLMQEIKNDYSSVSRKILSTCEELADNIIEHILKHANLPFGV